MNYEHPSQPAWCPGCGNYPLKKIMIDTLSELKIPPQNIVISSGIGQAAKMPQYLKVNYFNGLHGRALPAAMAIKLVNPQLTVIAEGGDGDMYGEGGNHFIHNIRRNPDIVHLVHNNQVYGLTKGQASPTSMLGFKTPVQVEGVILEPFNPLAVALGLGAGFVARVFTGNAEHTKQVLKEAFNFPGYALVDVLDPCVTFNKVNTFKWYKDNSHLLGDDHDPSDRQKAIMTAMKTDQMALGILFREQRPKPSMERILSVYETNQTPLCLRERDIAQVEELLK